MGKFRVRTERHVQLIIEHRHFQCGADALQSRLVGFQVYEQLGPMISFLILDPLLFAKTDDCAARRCDLHSRRRSLRQHKAWLKLLSCPEKFRRAIFVLRPRMFKILCGKLKTFGKEMAFVTNQQSVAAKVLKKWKDKHQKNRRKKDQN